MKPISIQLENQYRPNITSLYSLMEEIYNQYVYEVHTPMLEAKLLNELNQAIQHYYPLLNMIDVVELQVTEYKNMKIYFKQQFINEMGEKYPEALI